MSPVYARVVAVDQNTGEKQFSSNIYTDRKSDRYYGCVLLEKGPADLE